jgi:hypothetical protein
MRYLFAAIVLLYCGEAMAQQYPVCSFKMYSAVSGETPLTHTQQIAKTFPLYQSASFNWGLPFINKNYYYQPHQTISDAEILQLLDSAAAHNVNIILPDIVSWYAGTERFYLDANTQYFNTVRGVVDPDGQAEHPSVFYDNSALRATRIDAYMVESAKYQPVHPWFPGLSYRAYFRLKVSRPTGFDPNAEIGQIEVYDVTANNLILMKTLKNGDFGADNVYQAIDAGGVFHSDGSPETGSLHQFDFRVMWYGGPTTLWLDNIRVEGSFRTGTNPATLFSGGYDAAIKTAAKKFNAHPALARFYLSDEPCITMYLAYNYVNNILKIADQENGVNPNTGKGLAYVAKTQDDANYGTYSRYAQEAKPYELATDIYRFYKNDPLPSDPNYTSFAQNNALQTAIDNFRLAQQSSIYSESGMWQYFPNISRFTDATREPYLAEVYAQVNLALAYGAKGVHYFHYWTVNDGHPDFPIGLIDPATLDPINSSSPYSIYHENKWDGIKSLNQKLAGPLGTTLMTLTWQNAYSMHLQPSLAGTYFTSISTSDAANERYVELGLFKDAANRDYFMLVNRRTKSDESRNITAIFSLPSGSWEITDVASGNIRIILSNGTFTDSFAPGEGKLYRIAPAIWSITKTVLNTASISSGATLTVNPGTNVLLGSNVKIEVSSGGRIVANGASAQQIYFKKADSGGLDWNNILLYGDNNQFAYCTFDGGAYEVQIQSNNNQFTDCTFKNGMWGVYSYYTPSGGQSTFTLNHCLVTGNYFGMVIAGARPTINQTTIRDNDHYGVVLQNSVTNGFAANTIKNNGTEGLLVGTGGIAYSTGTLFYNNGIPSGRYGIYVDYYGYLNAGQFFRGSVIQGFNKISNTTGKYIYNLALTYNGEDYVQLTIPAQYNRWGEDGSVSGANFGYTPVDYSNPLSYDPTTGNPQLKAGTSVESYHPVSVLTSGIAQKIAAAANTSQKQFIVDLKSRMLEVRGEIDNRQNAQYSARLLGELNALSELDREDHTGEKASVRALLSEYRERLCLNQSNLFDGLCNEAALVNEVQNAIRDGDMDCAQNLIKEYSQYVRNDDNRRALLLAEAAIDERLGEYTQAMDALNTAKAIRPDARRMRRYVAPSYDYLETMIRQKAKAAGVALDDQQTQEQQQLMPTETLVLQNYPNPFNPRTAISYQLTVASRVSLKVYDILGREVATLVNEQKQPGYHTAAFDGSKLSSGIYFTRLVVQPHEGKQIVQVKKMVLLR